MNLSNLVKHAAILSNHYCVAVVLHASICQFITTISGRIICTSFLTYSYSSGLIFYHQAECFLSSRITWWACICLSLSTNTAHTSLVAAPPLLLSLTQWGVGQAELDSGVASVSLMIHALCCANWQVSTHSNSTHAYKVASWWLIVQHKGHPKLEEKTPEYKTASIFEHSHLLCNIWVSLGQYDSALSLKITKSHSAGVQ